MTERWPQWLRINENLKELTPYGAPQIDLPHRMNTNENPYSLNETVQKSISESIMSHLANLNRYPDRDADQLRGALASFINQRSKTNFGIENIWAANGSNEILQSIALAFQGDALGFEPSYSMHPLIARAVGKRWISVSRDAQFNIDVDSAIAAIESARPGIIFITTPNNPTGGSTNVEDISRIATVARETSAILVVDEAYAEFSSQPSAVTLINEHPNLIVSRTMSKAFAFAGARLGYLIAQPVIVEAMLLIRLPYHLSALTQAASLAALSNEDTLLSDVERISQSRNQLAQELQSIGLTVLPSDANFLLVGGFKESPQEIWKALVADGVLIRDVGIPGYLRVTVGTDHDNRALMSALKKRS